MSPLLVAEGRTEALEGTTLLELVPRNCTLEEYRKLPRIPDLEVRGDIIAYASPDSTYAVTRRLLDTAKKEVIIGIYDFSADYMKDLLLTVMQRGVKVSLMLDIDGTKEKEVFEELAKFGCKAVPAPSCASNNISYFPSSHEKVIIIDGVWSLVQSGNYSKNSIPFNEKDGGDAENFVTGNRDMGIAIRSRSLAQFFAGVLGRDMRLELDAAAAQAVGRVIRRKVEPDLVEAVPELLPTKLFPSKHFKAQDNIRVTPVLTPDNYMQVVPSFLQSARRSIYIEQQYIRGGHPPVTELLTAIKTARENNHDLDVRIILGRLFGGGATYTKERQNVVNLRKVFGLKLGENIRYIDQRRFVHCHNKLIVVDGKAALISSQNWSKTGVGSNREAGVLVRHPDIARYYAVIFESDWSTASKTIPRPKARTISPQALAKGNFVEVAAADYQEV